MLRIKKAVDEGCSLGLEAGMTFERLTAQGNLLTKREDLTGNSLKVKERNRALLKASKS